MVAERVTILSDAAAEAVRALRKREGMTRAELAASARDAGAPASFSSTVVGYIETGRRDGDGRRRREVSLDELAHLAAAVGTTPLRLLGGHAAALGAEQTAPCPRCDAATGAVERAVRDDIAALGDLEGTEPGLAATAYALAAALDGDDDTRQTAPLAKELRATLKAVCEAVAARTRDDDGDEDGDALGGLGDPD